MISNPEYVVAITGASGAPYGLRFLYHLLKRDFRISLVISEPGKLVIKHEVGITINEGDIAKQICTYLKAPDKEQLLKVYSDDNLLAPICSGSYLIKGMVIIPCSMATLGSIAGGISNSLIERTADVMLKESRPLMVVPRETPLNRIHLKNLLEIQRAGATIVPAMPAFYYQPSSIEDMIDFVVGKVFDQLNIEHAFFKRWEGQG